MILGPNMKPMPCKMHFVDDITSDMSVCHWETSNFSMTELLDTISVKKILMSSPK